MAAQQVDPAGPGTVQVDPPAVRLDEQGRYRVGKTRVLLDLVVQAFDDGATAEQIVQSYDSLSLADAYGAIAYYLRHRDEVRRYLAEMENQAEDIRKTFEGRQGDMRLIRDRLLARKNGDWGADAPVPQ
jgi:uncharacterized protein (DUF433 family)